MAQSTAPPGWKLTYVDGSRKAINPQGQTVSYNQYLNAQARQSGFKSFADYRKRAQQISAYRTKDNRSKLALGSKSLKGFKQTVLDRKRTTKADTAPGSKLARALEAIGVRPKGADYPVGDTPGPE